MLQLGRLALESVNKYKYLGFMLDEHLTKIDGCDTLSKSAGRALSAITSKLKKLKGEQYGSYSKLYDSSVDQLSGWPRSGLD